MDVEAMSAAVDALSGKWTLRVLAALTDGPQEHNRLGRITGLEHKALDRTLDRMVRKNLIGREIICQRPVRVSYYQTSLARALLSTLDELAGQWRHHASVDERVGEMP